MEEEKARLAELRKILRKKLTTWKRAALISNRFGFTKKILGQKRSGHLACKKPGSGFLCKEGS